MSQVTFLPWGRAMSSRSRCDAPYLAFIIASDLFGPPFDLARYAEISGIPVDVLKRDTSRLRRRGCLTPDLAIDWRNMPQVDLLGALEVMHRAAMDELACAIDAWADANPGKFDGWEATADFHPDFGPGDDLHGRLQ